MHPWAVWKYPISTGDNMAFILAMPFGARILTAQLQGQTPAIWALVDIDARKVERHFRVIGTGWEVDEEWTERATYVATLQAGMFVWHLFEETQHASSSDATDR